jgi:hypothetical protein
MRYLLEKVDPENTPSANWRGYRSFAEAFTIENKDKIKSIDYKTVFFLFFEWMGFAHNPTEKIHAFLNKYGDSIADFEMHVQLNLFHGWYGCSNPIGVELEIKQIQKSLAKTSLD